MKIALEILGLSAAPASNGTYALILKEVDGDRKLPIVIGQPEAAAIGYELEGMKPSRPMTHDLLRSIIEAFDGRLTEVLIHDLRDGTFFASLVIEGASCDIDARPSDAIALALRLNAPIYILESLLEEAGFEIDEKDEDLDDIIAREKAREARKATQNSEFSLSESDNPDSFSDSNKTERDLLEQMQKAIDSENYEKAAKLRDRIEKIRKEEKE